jgi:hypothetical protein
MSFVFKRVHHLIRYFVILGVFTFVGYVMRWHDNTFMALSGPPIYLANHLKKLILSYFSTIPQTETLDIYFLLMPVTLGYYTLAGFLTKQLWNEKGFIRSFSLVAFMGFLVYIHLKTFNDLSAYFTPNP